MSPGLSTCLGMPHVPPGVHHKTPLPKPVLTAFYQPERTATAFWHLFLHKQHLDYQDYQDPSRLPNNGLPWMAISKGKKQMLKNTPSHSSSDDQASF